jgi:hypothetical protein
MYKLASLIYNKKVYTRLSFYKKQTIKIGVYKIKRFTLSCIKGLIDL